MLSAIDFILARSSDDSPFKLIVGAIVVVFWIFGAIVSALNKKAEEAKRRRKYGQLPEGVARLPVTLPPPIRQQQQQRLARAQQQRQQQQRRPAAAAAMPPVPVVQSAIPVVTSARAISAAARAADAASADAVPMTARATQAAAAAKQASAKQIGRLLRRKDSLRAAFILNEVLSPPKAMRHE